MTVEAVIALGANLGDPVRTITQALRDLADLPETEVLGVSSLYRTAPHQATGPDFINAVARVTTRLSPHGLLLALQAQEQRAGRERPYPNAPRTLDLDLIFHGDAAIHTPDLTLPHPRWRERAFVLVPLAEIWPERVPAVDLQAVQHQAIEKLP